MYRPLAQVAEALSHTAHVPAPRMYPGMQPPHSCAFLLSVLSPVLQGVHVRSAVDWQSVTILSVLEQSLHPRHSLLLAYVPALHSKHVSRFAPTTILPALHAGHVLSFTGPHGVFLCLRARLQVVHARHSA